jgi:hypothetical protein
VGDECTLCFLSAPIKKSHANRSGDIGGQGMSPFLEMMWLLESSCTASTDTLAVWDVAPSCWNQLASLTWGNLVASSSVRKVSIMLA